MKINPNNIIFLCFGILLFISIYLNMSNKMALNRSNDLNDSLLERFEKEQQEQKKRITSDSIRYVVTIDSLSKEIKLIEKKRINERNALQSKIAKISVYRIDSDFTRYNDSIKVCCTMRHQ